MHQRDASMSDSKSTVSDDVLVRVRPGAPAYALRASAGLRHRSETERAEDGQSEIRAEVCTTKP